MNPGADSATDRPVAEVKRWLLGKGWASPRRECAWCFAVKLPLRRFALVPREQEFCYAVKEAVRRERRGRQARVGETRGNDKKERGLLMQRTAMHKPSRGGSEANAREEIASAFLTMS